MGFIAIYAHALVQQNVARNGTQRDFQSTYLAILSVLSLTSQMFATHHFRKERKMKVDYQWHNAPKELPDCEATCVTFFHGFYRINVWNPYYQCWDDSEGDDFEISGDAELRWMALEEEESK